MESITNEWTKEWNLPIPEAHIVDEGLNQDKPQPNKKKGKEGNPQEDEKNLDSDQSDSILTPTDPPVGE